MTIHADEPQLDIIAIPPHWVPVKEILWLDEFTVDRCASSDPEFLGWLVPETAAWLASGFLHAFVFAPEMEPGGGMAPLEIRHQQFERLFGGLPPRPDGAA